MVLAYFIAGFFVSALPWAPVAAVLTNGIGLWRQSANDGFMQRWWEISRGHAMAMIAGRLALWVAIDTLAMFASNWMRATL